MLRTLHTIGYQKRTIDEFLELLIAADIGAVIDVRETAWSHKPGFSKGSFSEALASAGIDYIHAPFAGNPKALRNKARSHAACLAAYRRYLEAHTDIVARLDAFVQPYLLAGINVCITCFERHADDCHRSILADLWCQHGRRSVKHLATAGCSRLIPV